MASNDADVVTAADELVRAFTDSSILVAAALSQTGAAYGLVEFARQGRVLLFASLYALDEAERSLYRKSPRGLRAFWDLRDQLQLVDPSPAFIVEVAQNVEQKDAAIVAGAVVARAHFLVSHDHRHLLSQTEHIQSLYGIKTVEPVAVLKHLRGL